MRLPDEDGPTGETRGTESVKIAPDLIRFGFGEQTVMATNSGPEAKRGLPVSWPGRRNGRDDGKNVCEPHIRR